MTVFKAFWKIVNKYKITIIIYTVILIIFAGANMQTNDTSMNFVASKPDVLIINNDENIGITKDLTNYIEERCNIIDVKQEYEAINDALFYRDVNYIIYIPKNYRKDLLEKHNPEIEIKSTKDAQSTFAEMMLSRYVNLANIYANETENEEELISKINNTLDEETKIEMTSKLDTDNLSKAVFYYNFLNYSILARISICNLFNFI